LAIKSFASKKLKNFYYNDDASGLNHNHLKALAYALDAIDASHHPQHLKAIYLNKFAEKKGSGAGVYSIEINGNWRLTFQISDDGAILLDYVDYHGKQIKAR
jgi:toxin HigB-1